MRRCILAASSHTGWRGGGGDRASCRSRPLGLASLHEAEQPDVGTHFPSCSENCWCKQHSATQDGEGDDVEDCMYVSTPPNFPVNAISTVVQSVVTYAIVGTKLCIRHNTCPLC